MIIAHNKCIDIPERISGLVNLSYNFWWSWHDQGRLLFKKLSRTEWKNSGHNPVKMLCEINPAVLTSAAKDSTFLRYYDRVIESFNSYMKKSKGWFQEKYQQSTSYPIAFFSAEYGFHHSLPFYAGGLGFFAGDLLKESSDLGIPIIGVGFMYPKGYTKQEISSDGWQIDKDEPIDREKAPISRIFDSKGNRIIIQIPIFKPNIFVEVWKVQIGRVPLYLIDTDIDENDPWNRPITSHLYTANAEQRLKQEIILGIGGIYILNKLGIKFSSLHLNEGHTVFALLERIKEKVQDNISYEEAFAQVRATSLFTTHTSVAAGHDVFPFSLIEKYFSSYIPSLKIDFEKFLKIGVNPNEPNSGFNMTVFGLNVSQYHNAVSKKHGDVARRMWHSLWPKVSEKEVPIDYITNGIHIPTWLEPRIHVLFDKYLEFEWLKKLDDPFFWQNVENIPDKELWTIHYILKTKLIMRILERARQRWINENPDPRMLLTSGVFLDPNVLTIGFARRFAAYKRATLILRNIKRLQAILNNRWKPVQIIFAGKAHPADEEGKRIIQQVISVARDPSSGGRIAFIENYDEQLAQYFIHGVDIWLNTPLFPLEACGTSGMKSSLNGIPNLSILDGWWLEGFNKKNGWAFGKDKKEKQDYSDSEELYNILENSVIPLFYKLDEEDIPSDWVKVMKETIKSNAAFFSTRRMMKEYAVKYYQKILKSNLYVDNLNIIS